MKPKGRICWAATKVNVFSPVISNIVEVDVFICAEDETIVIDMAR